MTDNQKTKAKRELSPEERKLKEQQRELKRKNYVFESNRKYFTICVYAFCLVLISAICVYAILNLSAVKRTIESILKAGSPFIVAILIAYLLNPFLIRVKRFYNKHFFKGKMEKTQRILSIITCYTIFVGLFVVAVVYVVPELGRSIQDLAKSMTTQIPNAYDKITKYIINLEKDVPGLDLSFLEQQFENQQEQLINYGTNIITNGVPYLINLSVSIAKIFIDFLLAIVISCYIIMDKKSLSKNMKKLVYAIFQKKHGDGICIVGKECSRIFSGFLIGKTMDSLIIGCLCFVCMIILRFPYAILISVFVGITNMIPYFGPFIGAVPGVIIYLLINPKQAVLFAILILVLQQFDGLYLGPKILGDSVGLKPLWVIFAITIGGAYFGIVGMFLGVPVVAVIAYLLLTIIDHILADKGIEIAEETGTDENMRAGEETVAGENMSATEETVAAENMRKVEEAEALENMMADEKVTLSLRGERAKHIFTKQNKRTPRK